MKGDNTNNGKKLDAISCRKLSENEFETQIANALSNAYWLAGKKKRSPKDDTIWKASQDRRQAPVLIQTGACKHTLDVKEHGY